MTKLTLSNTPQEAVSFGELTTPRTENATPRDIEAAQGNGLSLKPRQGHHHQDPQEQDPQEQDEQDDSHANLMHGINTFWALISPVAVTMLLTLFVVTHYQSHSLQNSMRSFLVFQSIGSSDTTTTTNVEDDNNNPAVGESLVNALVIIGVLACMTFALAFLYKFNCFNVLIGYILIAAAAILGFNGGQLLEIILVQRFQWNIDWITLVFAMYNFAMTGVIAIFYQKGISTTTQHIYLILVSVILAWQFSMWPEWTTWVFCIMFAVYDLCAVLTPCGPLKCLIGLIQEKQAPMPGLLYEAEIVNGTGSQKRSRQEEKRTPAVPAPVYASPSVSSALVPTTMKGLQVPDEALTLSELQAQLKAFYELHNPDDAWKASQAAETFFLHQESLWLRLYHKYQLCTCSDEIPCKIVLRDEEKRKRLEEEEQENATIKLGLGDFIFYSVLVGRAGLYDFSTMAVTFVCIILGLGGTLFLLSVLHKALPALPISIFLATSFYFLTRYLLVDMINFIGDVILLL